MWSIVKWWTTKGEITPVKWELEVKDEKTDELLKSLQNSGEGGA